MDLGLDGGNEAMNWFSAPDNIAIAWQLSACLTDWLALWRVRIALRLKREEHIWRRKEWYISKRDGMSLSSQQRRHSLSLSVLILLSSFVASLALFLAPIRLDLSHL
jgi:hypothetical protein